MIQPKSGLRIKTRLSGGRGFDVRIVLTMLSVLVAVMVGFGILYFVEGRENLELKEQLVWSRDKINEISDKVDSLWRENARLEDANSKMQLVLDLAG